jgi:hypothetical protein
MRSPKSPAGLARWKVLVAALVVGLVSVLPARAQGISYQDPPDRTIDAAVRAKVLEAVLQNMRERYVFPEAGDKVQQALQRRVEGKEYDNITSAKEFAATLTKHLQEVTHDKHVRVRYTGRPFPKRPEGDRPDPAAEERMRSFARRMNAGYHKVERLGGNVGYLELRNFADAGPAAEPAAAAMNFLANTDALIIDLRRNGGGSPRGVALLCSYFFDEKPVHLNSLYWREGNRTEDFHTFKDVAGKRYLGKDVYVLTSGRTFSGAEEFTYNLQTQKRATIVGETTGGGAHPGGMFPAGDGFAMFVSTGRAINPITKTNWEGTGVKPDIAVSADQALEVAHQHAVKKLLEQAKDEETRRLIQGDVDAHGRSGGPKKN